MKGLPGKRMLSFALIIASLWLLGGCGGDDPAPGPSDPATPWTATAVSASWLDNNPFYDYHDGGWVYSAREDRIYAIYGDDGSGQTLYRINHIDNTYEVATNWLFDRHGSHPVIDDTGTYIYMPPSQNSAELERYNTVTDTREDLATAPNYGTFSHGAWKGGKLWIVLDDYELHSFNPADNTWSAGLYNFGDMYANVATSGPGSNLIYIMAEDGSFYSYNVSTDNVTTLESHPFDFGLGGNAQFTWFGASTGYIYARDCGNGFAPAIYDIANDTWESLSDPKTSDGYDGHATYDSKRGRLYFSSYDDISGFNFAWYYQF